LGALEEPAVALLLHNDQKDRHIPNEQLGRIIALPKLISAIRVRSEIYGAIWWN